MDKKDIKRADNLKKYPIGIIYRIQRNEVTRDKYIKFCERLDDLHDWIKKDEGYKYEEL